MVMAATLAILDAASALPDVTGGTAPPGSEDIVTVLRWVFWLVAAACIAGFWIVAAKMAVAHRRGEGYESLSGLGLVLGACVLLASGSAIAATLLGGGTPDA